MESFTDCKSDSRNILPKERTYMNLLPFRLAIHVMTQIEQRGLQKQWSWEPMMAESLILALVDHNDVRLLTLCSILSLVTSKIQLVTF